MKTITISKQEYKKLKRKAKLNMEHLENISKGIKDALTKKVEEI